MLRNAFVLVFMLVGVKLMGQFSISGQVFDEEKKPLAGANVVLVGTQQGTITNSKGYFYFLKVPQGNYQLQVSFVGCEPYQEEIELQADWNSSIALRYDNILAEEIIVKSTRAGKKSPIAKTNVAKEEIEQRNLGQDIPFLLSMTPSFVATSDAGTGVGYTNFRIRGTDANRINITVNGIPMNDAESHGVWWVNMPDLSSSIENIQVQRGVGTSTHGAGAFGATINMQTNTLKKDAYAEFQGSMGSFNTYKTTAKVGTGLVGEGFSFDARLSKLTSDGYIDRGWSDLKSFFVSGGYHTEKSIVKVNIFSGKEHTYQAWNGVPGDLLKTNRTYNSAGEYTDVNGQTAYYDNETDNYQQDHYQLFLSHELSPAFSVNAAFHYTYGRGYYEQYKEDEDLADYLIDDVIVGNDTVRSTNLIRQKWLDNDFYGGTFSLNYTASKLDMTLGGAWNKYDGRHFGEVTWARFMGNVEKGHEWYRNTGDKTDFNLFLKTNIQTSDWMSVYADLQFRSITHDMQGLDDDQRDITQKHEFNFFNPKLGLHFNPLPDHTAYIFYAVAHREPNRSNFTDADPNSSLPKEEMLQDIELGYTLKHKFMTFGLNAYYMIYKDQLVLTGEINDVGGAIMTNVDKSYRRGIEAMIGIQLLHNLSLQANATFSQNKIKDFTEYVDNWDTWEQEAFKLGETDLAFSPNVVFNSRLAYTPLKPLTVALNSQYVGEQFMDNTSSSDRQLDAYFVNNIEVAFVKVLKTSKEIEIKFLLNNIFDVEYESNAWVYSYMQENQRNKLDGFYPQAGVNYLLGMSIKF